ncbi:MAG: protein kinase [Bacteroidales bacterium]|nr:protein kinase [Bacteroidales bacterium]
MVTNDLGACEWFVWDLRRSGLIERGQLDQLVSEFLKRNPRADAPALAGFLVQQNALTSFQAERILASKSQGLVLGPYVLQDTIGQGSMGQVYKATSKNDTNIYAVKVLPRRSMWNVRLAKRQVRSFSQFSHPTVVPFVDVGTAGGMHYLAWPFAEGTTLEQMVQQTGRLTAQQSALIGMQIAQGLAICQQNSIFHGLLKPSNIMIGTDNVTRVLDYGIGSLLVENEGESLVDTMSTANTLTSGLDCAAPESIMDPTNRTAEGDQYSLGCILYYCLTGQFPFPEGSAVEKMMAHQAKEPEPIRTLAPDCPEGLAAIVSQLMAKTPESRFRSADEIAEALETYAGDLVQPSAPMTYTPAPVGTMGNRLGQRPGLGLGGASNPGSPAHLPTPTRNNPFPQAPTPTQPSAGFGQTGTPPPIGSRTPFPPAGMPHSSGQAPPATLPTRASFKLPAEPTEVPLAPANPEQAPFPADPAMRSSTAWINAPEDPRRGGSNTLGTVVVAVLLTALVFIGAYLLLTMNK